MAAHSAPGEDEDLYTFLIKQEKYSATQAEIVLQLLHSPFDPAQPETYQTLIGYLGSDTLPVRMKDDYDGAEPAGNSIALMNLVRLARITGREDFQAAADRGFRALAPRVAAQPAAVPALLSALLYSHAHPRQIVLAGDRDSESTRAFLERLHERFRPDNVVLLVDSDETRNRLGKFNPVLAGMRPGNGRTMAYVCRDFACDLPTDNVERFAELLK